jgi:hypothetical protein
MADLTSAFCIRPEISDDQSQRIVFGEAATSAWVG